MSAVESQFAKAFYKRLDTFGPQLSVDLGGVRLLDPAQKDVVLRFLLASACQAQGSEPLRLGRQGLQNLPREWLVENIERVAVATVRFDDEYEFRLLLEAILPISSSLVRLFVTYGLMDADEDIRATAEEFAKTLAAEPDPAAEPDWTQELLGDDSATGLTEPKELPLAA